MGCVTSEFALILGLYTFKRKTASLASAHSRFSRLAGPEVTAVCTLYFTKGSATHFFCTIFIIVSLALRWKLQEL